MSCPQAHDTTWTSNTQGTHEGTRNPLFSHPGTGGRGILALLGGVLWSYKVGTGADLQLPQ